MARTSQLGELERAVMGRLWSAGPEQRFTVREVHEILAADRDIAYTTVMTVMNRLSKKGWVRQETDGRAYRYQAALSRGEMTAGLMRETLEEIAGDDRFAALAAFVEEASAEERAAMRDSLEEHDVE